MQRDIFDSSLEVKFLAPTGSFEGYASVFDVTDQVKDRVARGAFRKSLAGFQDEGRLPPLLWQHDSKEPIGAWREVYEDEHGLFVKGELFVDDIPRAKQAYKLLSEGVVTGLSIGYRVKESEFDAHSGVRVLTEVSLLEISLVTFPALESARISAVKSFLSEGKIPSERDFEAFLREAGFSRKQAKGLLAQGYKSLLQRDADAEEIGAGEIQSLTHILWRLAASLQTHT